MHFGNLNFGRNWQKSVSAKMVSTGLNHGFNWFKPLMLSRNMPTLGYFNPKLMTGRTTKTGVSGPSTKMSRQ